MTILNIPISKYIDITTVAGTSKIPGRSYALRIFTTTVPLGDTAPCLNTYSTAIEVATAITSETINDYASNYFSYVNKNASSVAEIQVYSYKDSTSITDAITNSISADNNFGSLYIDSIIILTLAETIAISTLLKTLKSDYLWMYETSYSGSTLIGLPTSNAVIDVTSTSYIPAAELASINFNNVNSISSFNYLISPVISNPLNPLWYNDAISDSLNFVGTVQQNGARIWFWQPGNVIGSSISNIAEYVGAMWIQTSATAVLLDLFLEVNTLPSNSASLAILRQVLTIGVIEPGLYNGAIQRGRSLTASEIAEVTTDTGNKTAYQNIETLGYYLTVSVKNTVAYFTLYYLQNEQIAKIVGSNIAL